MEMMLLVLGVIVVWLGWRMVKVQAVRAQVEAIKVDSEHAAREIDRVTRTLGTPEDAKRAGRLIEYYDQLSVSLGLDEDDVKRKLHVPGNVGMLRGLVEESVGRGMPCRFLESYDFDRFVNETDFPGPEPEASSVFTCSDGCNDAMEVELPRDAATCPFCSAPTKHIMWKAETYAEQLDRWRVHDRAWQLWKRYKPAIAAKQEAEARAEIARSLNAERVEFQAALAAFKAKGGQAKAEAALVRKETTSQACPACPQCRAPTILIAEFNRWRCDRCNVYA